MSDGRQRYLLDPSGLVPPFLPAFEACGLFVECSSAGGDTPSRAQEENAEDALRVLLLLRQDHKSEPNVWGIPGGKVDPQHVPLPWVNIVY